MSLSHLSPEQAERAEQLFQSLRQAAAVDLRGIAELLASKPDHQVLGRPSSRSATGRQIGAKAIEAALDERKKGGTGGPVCCPCGEDARFVGYRGKGMLCLLGPIRPDPGLLPLRALPPRPVPR